MKKVLAIRHAKERRDDRVSAWMEENDVEIHVAIPASGAPLPRNKANYDALVVYGGVQSANDGSSRPYIDHELDYIADWATSGRPVLGICLGAQMLAKSLGGTVMPRSDGRFEIGFNRVVPLEESDGFLKQPSYFYQWHGEGFTIPQDGVRLAGGEVFPNQAFRYGQRAYGVQFHPEVTLEIMREWLSYNEGKLESKLGAHSAERQIDDESRYGDDMQAWLHEFLNNWKQTW